MTNGNQPPEGIKITLEDLDAVATPGGSPSPITPVEPGSRSYGTISEAADPSPAVAEEHGSIFLKAWFYLGAAGFLGAAVAWAICEPAFVDGPGHRWGNYLMLPLIVALVCVSFGIAESIAEQAPKKALFRTLISLPLGLVLGGILQLIAEIAFSILLGVIGSLGVHDFKHPAFWISRGLAWAVFGAAGGIVYGIVGQSAKKGQYGVLGGMIGAAVGGMIFDPIAMAVGGENAALSRVIGFSILGLAAGASMGVVESALKNRWLYVTAGPLAGKQFILYKAQTSIGSLQQADIYLFKDQSILPNHAMITTQGPRVRLTATGPAFVAGSPVHDRLLRDGDLIQIGRYTFRYKEKASK
jgi:hypothetical protein